MIILTILVFIPQELRPLPIWTTFLSSLLKCTNVADISYLDSGSSCGHAIFNVSVVIFTARTLFTTGSGHKKRS